MRPMQVVAFWESVNLEDPTSVLTPLGVSAFGCGQIMKAMHVSLLSAVVSGCQRFRLVSWQDESGYAPCMPGQGTYVRCMCG